MLKKLFFIQILFPKKTKIINLASATEKQKSDNDRNRIGRSQQARIQLLRRMLFAHKEKRERGFHRRCQSLFEQQQPCGGRKAEKDVWLLLSLVNYYIEKNIFVLHFCDF